LLSDGYREIDRESRAREDKADKSRIQGRRYTRREKMTAGDSREKQKQEST
jgi:hypothetical protein